MSFKFFSLIFYCFFLMLLLNPRALAMDDLLSITLEAAPPPYCPPINNTFLTESFYIRIHPMPSFSNSSNTNQSSMFLRLYPLPSSSPPFKIFALNSKGQKQKVDLSSSFARFSGVMCDELNPRKVYAMGTVQPNIISLVIVSLDLYITPAAVKSPRQLSLNPHKNHTYLPQILTSILGSVSQRNTVRGGMKKKRTRRFLSNVSSDYGDWNSNKNRICGVKIRVMYDLYEKVFHRNIHKSVLLVQYVVRFAHEIFRNTFWTNDGYFNETKFKQDRSSLDGVFYDYGFSLCEVDIETELPEGYQWVEQWNEHSVKSYILDSISDVNKCLSHALTNRQMVTDSGGTMLGISYTDGLFSKRNGGVSSFSECQDPWNTKCVLSVVHEFGHSWGSYHDADAEGCFPSARDGGSFLMAYPFLAEIGPNNFYFSPCSIRAIYKVIERMRNNFIKPLTGNHCGMVSDCGDNIVQNGEQCDDESHCCNDHCQLRQGALCSPSNGLCCDPDTCQPRDSSAMCYPQDLDFCLDRAYCDGSNHICPNRKPMPNGSACVRMGQNGTCSDGYCHLYCPRGEAPCRCELEFQCYQCCGTGMGAACKPAFPLVDDSPCRFNGSLPGQCHSGQCESIDKDFPVIIDDDARDGAGKTTTTIAPEEEEELEGVNYVMISTVLVLTLVLVAFLVMKLFYHKTNKFHYIWNLDEADSADLISIANGFSGQEQPLNGQENSQMPTVL